MSSPNRPIRRQAIGAMTRMMRPAESRAASTEPRATPTEKAARKNELTAWSPWMVSVTSVAIVLSLMATLVTETIHGDQAVNSFFLAAFSVGVALGSVLAARLSAGRIILVIAPIACLLMGLFGLDIAWIAGHFQAAGPVGLGGFLADFGNYRLLADLILLA